MKRVRMTDKGRIKELKAKLVQTEAELRRVTDQSAQRLASITVTALERDAARREVALAEWRELNTERRIDYLLHIGKQETTVAVTAPRDISKSPPSSTKKKR